MAITEGRTRDRHPAGASGTQVGPLRSRALDFEAVGRLVGVFGVLLVLAVTVGSGPRI